MDRAKITALFETYIRKLRITPAWDVRLEFVGKQGVFLWTVQQTKVLS